LSEEELSVGAFKTGGFHTRGQQSEPTGFQS